MNPWDTNAQPWIDAVRQGRIASRLKGTNAAIVQAVLSCNPRTVLDLGCGEGWLCRELHQASCQVTGVDGSAQLIEAAKAAGQETYFVSDYEAFEADPFDAVVTNFALFDEDLTQILNNVRRLLKPDGHFILQTLHPASAPDVEGWHTESFSTLEGTWTPIRWYSRSEAGWRAVLEDAGFHINQILTPEDPASGAPLSLLIICKMANQLG